MLQCRSKARKGWSMRPGGEHRDVVVAGNDEERPVERVEVARGGLVLVRTAAMGEIPARRHEIGRDTLDERADPLLQRRVVEAVPRAEMEVGHVEDGR